MAYSNRSQNNNRNYQMFWYPYNSNPVRYEDMEFSHLLSALGKLQRRKEQGLPVFSEVAFMRLLQEVEVRTRKSKAGIQEQSQEAQAPVPDIEPHVIPTPSTNGQGVDLDQIPF